MAFSVHLVALSVHLADSRLTILVAGAAASEKIIWRFHFLLYLCRRLNHRKRNQKHFFRDFWTADDSMSGGAEGTQPLWYLARWHVSDTQGCWPARLPTLHLWLSVGLWRWRVSDTRAFFVFPTLRRGFWEEGAKGAIRKTFFTGKTFNFPMHLFPLSGT